MLASMAAQHFGGKVGGFVAGLPATAVLAIFFITCTEGPRHGFDLAGVFPLAISVNAVFLAAFAALSRKSFSAGLLASSDLLHGHGAGPQPWEDLVERRASSTRVTLHRVSPTIDDGDIVGQSPEINVRLPDGSVSNDVRMIGEKTLVPVNPMVRELALALVERKASGLKGPLDTLDFERIFSPDFKSRLMEPLDPLGRGHILPLSKDEEQYSV